MIAASIASAWVVGGITLVAGLLFCVFGNESDWGE